MALAGRKFDKQQLEQLWVKAGGPQVYADMASAVALAESSGYSEASNANTDGSTDRGLWQINSVHGYLSTFSIPGNARAAVIISSGGKDWSPWVTWKKGAELQYLRSRGAAGTAGAGPNLAPASSPAGVTGGVLAGPTPQETAAGEHDHSWHGLVHNTGRQASLHGNSLAAIGRGLDSISRRYRR